MTEYLDKPEPSYAEIATVYDELTLWSAHFGILLLEHLEFRPDLNILDVGCATGFPLLELANVHGPSCQLVGLDTWEDALQRAKLKCAVQQLDNVALVAADAAQMPLPDGRFDLIVSNLGINNFENPQAVLSECSRVAKPGARLVLTTNPRGHMREFYAVFRQVLIDLGRNEQLEPLQAAEDHRGTKEGIGLWLEEAGFRVTRVVEDAFFLRYLDGTAFFNHWLTRIGFLDSWRRLALPDEREVFAVLERRLNEIAASEGELRLTVPMLYIEAEKPAD